MAKIIVSTTLILLTIVFIIYRLLMNYQRDTDRLHGIEQPRDAYTFSGMLRIMRAERKEQKKAERKERILRATQNNTKTSERKINIRKHGI